MIYSNDVEFLSSFYDGFSGRWLTRKHFKDGSIIETQKPKKLKTKLGEVKYFCSKKEGCGRQLDITYDDIIRSRGYSCEHCGYTYSMKDRKNIRVLNEAEKNRKHLKIKLKK